MANNNNPNFKNANLSNLFAGTVSSANLEVLVNLGIADKVENITKAELAKLSPKMEKTAVAIAKNIRDLQRAHKQGIQVSDFEQTLSQLQTDASNLAKVIEDSRIRAMPDDKGKIQRYDLNAMRAQTALKSALGIKFPTPEEEAYEKQRLDKLREQSEIRADVRMGRVLAQSGGGLTPELREKLERDRENIRQALPGMSQAYFEAREKGEFDRARQIATETTAANNLLKEITHVLEYGQGKQQTTLNRALNALSTIISALGVGSVASRIFLQEPYQYGTRPAINTLSNQGELGQILGSAFGELEQHRLSLNQMSTMTGFGLLGGSLGAFGSGNVVAGALMGAGALAFTIPGLRQNFDDIWMNTLGIGEDEILSKSIAQAVAKPSRLVDHFRNSRAGLMAMGGTGENQFGFFFDGAAQSNRVGVGRTGNMFLDQISTQLAGLGYSGEEIGVMSSQTALNLRGGVDDMINYTADVGRISAAYAISQDSVLANLQTAQRFGATDASASLYGFIGGAADRDGNITSYTTNVLVPALMKVTESLAVQNLARGADELQTEVLSLRRNIVQSDTRIGRLVEQNPEVLNRVISTLQEAAGAALDNPAMMAFNLATGSSFEDMVMKRPEVIERNLRTVLNSSVARGINFNDPSHVFSTGAGIGALYYASALTRINDFQVLQQLLATLQQQGTLTGGGQQLVESMMDAGKTDVEGRTMAIEDSYLGQLTQSLAEQTNQSIITTQMLVENLQEIQSLIAGFVGNAGLVEAVKQGITDIYQKLEQILNKYGGSASIPNNINTDNRNVTIVGNSSTPAPPMQSAALGGYIGAGGVHQIAGVVHGGEYVISQNNVARNREVLDRIQSGERVSDVNISNSGGVTYVTLKVHGATVEDIYRTAQAATEDYITSRRLNYT